MTDYSLAFKLQIGFEGLSGPGWTTMAGWPGALEILALPRLEQLSFYVGLWALCQIHQSILASVRLFLIFKAPGHTSLPLKYCLALLVTNDFRIDCKHKCKILIIKSVPWLKIKSRVLPFGNWVLGWAASSCKVLRFLVVQDQLLWLELLRIGADGIANHASWVNNVHWIY